jgi:FkbM family methyltransferase
MDFWRKRGLTFEVRPDTSDWNTVEAAVGEDEYGLEGIDVAGKFCIDAGAHIGSVGVWLASRGAKVAFIEPIPENLSMIGRNIELNFPEPEQWEEIILYNDAVGPARGQTEIHYAYTHDENSRHHAFIGNDGDGGGEHSVVAVQTVSLGQIVEEHGTPFLVKLDCEGGEWDWILEPELRDVQLIVGEWHPVKGHVLSELLIKLEATHDVTTAGPEAGPGGFRAERR